MNVVDISIVNYYNKFVKAFSYEKVCLFQNLAEMSPMKLFKFIRLWVGGQIMWINKILGPSSGADKSVMGAICLPPRQDCSAPTRRSRECGIPIHF